MEYDHDCGLIEKRKRVINNVFVPEDWMDIVKVTSKNFNVIPMNHEDFFSVQLMDKFTKMKTVTLFRGTTYDGYV